MHGDRVRGRRLRRLREGPAGAGRPSGERRDHDETWLVLFDLYRAIGQNPSSRRSRWNTSSASIARHRNGSRRSSNSPRLRRSPESARPRTGGIGWHGPPNLDGESVSRLDALSMQLLSPWVMDWTALASIDVEAASRLQKLFSRLGQPAAVDELDRRRQAVLGAARDRAHRRATAVIRSTGCCAPRRAAPGAPAWTSSTRWRSTTASPSRCRRRAGRTCALQGAAGSAARRTPRRCRCRWSARPRPAYDTSMINEDEPRPRRCRSPRLNWPASWGDLGELLGRLTAQVGDSRVIRISRARG